MGWRMHRGIRGYVHGRVRGVERDRKAHRGRVTMPCGNDEIKKDQKESFIPLLEKDRLSLSQDLIIGIFRIFLVGNWEFEDSSHY